MGKLIKFPGHRVIHKKDPLQPQITEEEARKIKEGQFIEQITESLTLDIIHVLQENATDTKSDIFLRDLAIVIESLKSLLKRDFDRTHPMQFVTDSIAKIHTLPDGRKMTDINYSKIKIQKKKKKKIDPKELDIQFDPDINLD
tara:strand:+ start:715 stop:1143 length:429 start_codon:yes stop_codon:yes gene_type:complete